jgi:hypothetical protein
MHTKRSPSQAKRFGECPGTLAICDALPPEQRGASGEAARIGTCVHKIIEHALRHGEEPETYRGRIIEIINEGEENEDAKMLPAKAKTPRAGRTWYEVDSAMIDGATMMTEYVRKRCAELGIAESDLELETRTNPLPDRNDTSGTADVTLNAWPLLLEVADYKNGYLEVDHKDNDQLLAYLLGKALETGMTHEVYSVTVIQPNCQHEDGRIRSVDATKPELLAFQKKYAKRIAKCEEAERAFANDVPMGALTSPEFNSWAGQYLKAGDHCTFCDAKAVCPAYKAAALAQAQDDFAGFDEEPEALTLPDHEESIARVLAWAPHMEALIAAARAWAYRAFQAGRRVSGQKMVRGKSNRKWIDEEPDALVKSILKQGFVDDKAKLFTKPQLITGPAAEQLVARKRRKDFAAAFLFKPEGELKLVASDDPRDEVVIHAGDDFKGLDADEFDFG